MHILLQVYAPTLEPGSYTIKVCVDKTGKLAKSPLAMLDESDYLGQTTIDARWRDGFRKAELFALP